MTTLTHPAEARRRFREFAESEITNENLALGALLVSVEDNPHVDLDGYLSILNDLGQRVRAKCSPGEPAVFQLGHLHSEMFDVDAYRGDETNYYDPRNAYLDQVIDRRIGLPLTLSIIFLHAASMIGLNAFGVGLPGHYIVKVQFELNEVYVDPFHSGTTMTVSEIGQMISQITGGRARLTSQHLRSWTGRETLQRLLSNLQNMWTRAGDTRKAAAAGERMELLQR